jgi:hypothetical protein
MNCPPEVAEVLLEILSIGLLRIRAAGWSKNPSRCAIEADHLHNLPALLDNYSLERLKYYWEAEKPGFERQLSPGDLGFQSAWSRLESILSAVPA